MQNIEFYNIAGLGTGEPICVYTFIESRENASGMKTHKLKNNITVYTTFDFFKYDHVDGILCIITIQVFQENINYD